jgi:hypothetical protein
MREGRDERGERKETLIIAALPSSLSSLPSLLLPMPNSGPVATLLAADLATAFSGLLGTH